MNDFNVRDQRKPGHHWADNEVMDDYGKQIGMQGYSIYMYLCRHAGNRNGKCSRTHAEIAEAFGASRFTVMRHIIILTRVGLISIEKQGGDKSIYVIMEVPKRLLQNATTLVANCNTPLLQNATPLLQIATSNKEVRLSQDLELKLPLSRAGKKQVPSANDLQPQDAERAVVELLGVSGYTAFAARDAVGSVKRRKPELRYSEIPEFIVMLWGEVKSQPKRALPSLKTFLNEIGQYVDSDHWRIKKESTFTPTLDWQGGYVGENGVYVNKHGKKVPGFVCPPKPKELAGD